MIDRRITHRGWLLVETGHNYYSACKGNLRVGVGSMRHADKGRLVAQFRRKVNELEGDNDAAQG